MKYYLFNKETIEVTELKDDSIMMEYAKENCNEKTFMYDFNNTYAFTCNFDYAKTHAMRLADQEVKRLIVEIAMLRKKIEKLRDLTI